MRKQQEIDADQEQEKSDGSAQAMTVRVDHGPPLVREVAGVGRPSAPPARHPDGRPRAGDYILAGARIQAEVASKPGDLLNSADTRLAENWLESALAPLPGEIAEVGVGGELVPVGDTGDAPMLRNTVANPNYVTADAVRARIELAHKADVLELALDASETVDPRNSLEKMLAHQLTAAHRSAMKMSAEMNRRVEYLAHVRGEEQERANIQATRLASASARMMTAFQQGLLTLQRLRMGGQQVVTVQHVQVNEGGQAVVAGTVGRGSRKEKMWGAADES